MVYEMEGTGSFWIDASGENVWYELAPGASTGDVDHVLGGPVLGIAFKLRNWVLLHAGAVLVDGRALAFSAPHGAGKSTLSSAFVGAGYPLITDDLLGLRTQDQGWQAVQSLPRLKLWADSAEQLLGTSTPTSPVLSWAAKRRLNVGEHWGMAAPENSPLGAIYFLRPRRESGVPVSVDALAGPAATLMLVGGMYSPDLLHGERAVKALDAATRVAATVPVRVVSYHRSFENLPAIRQAILSDFEEVSRG